jgi:hypothetical protein
MRTDISPDFDYGHLQDEEMLELNVELLGIKPINASVKTYFSEVEMIIILMLNLHLT